jgi:hypothetical protein
MPRQISPSTSLDTLRKEAKRWLRALREGNPVARERFELVLESSSGVPPPESAPATPVLRDVQHALARDYGYDGWIALTRAVRQTHGMQRESSPLRSLADYERAAADWVAAYDARDPAALERLSAHSEIPFAFDDLGAIIWRRNYAFRQRSSNVEKNFLKPDEAQLMVAQDAGFGSWTALVEAIETGTQRPPGYALDEAEKSIGPRRLLNAREWNAVADVINARGVTTVNAHGMMTDDVLGRIADLRQVTKLHLGGCRALTDEGLKHLARMTQLEHLELSEYPGGKLGDRGLEVLRHLPNLRVFEMTWQRGITDTGVANLRYCERLERVNLMGTLTGDRAIAALQGKPALRSFSTGRLVTDEGLKLLRNFPVFEAPNPDQAETRLLIDGPFTDAGLAGLAGLDGVTELDLFWHVTGMTSNGFAHLAGLRNLATLGADGKLSDDVALAHIAAIPRLRKLRAQEAVASDAGFEALGRSRTLEWFWGRVCPNFADRGFLALSRIPTLQGFGVGCRNVSDAALAALPRFPSLVRITPIDFTDAGFRHVGQCAQLEDLQCMYCRDTTDAATAHIAGLQLKKYYAGLTQITDVSLEILGRMASLEEIEFFECLGITDAGLPYLAKLPRLREVEIAGSQQITLEGTRVFPPRVRVRYET